MPSVGTLRAAAVWLLTVLIAVGSAQAVDLTGSWWVHTDPPDPGSYADVTMDIVQSGATLTITNVQLTTSGVTPGYGSGTIEPATGVFDAIYGYSYFAEPVGTALSATASLDGLSFTGEADVRIVLNSVPLYMGPVIGVRLTGEPVCGNGQLEPREDCDDGNLTSGDGCSAACYREPRCGDRIRDPYEECDDGNTTDGDGCSATCIREPRCGDGIRDPGEQCDDGNSNEADSCSSACLLTQCGNSVVVPGEQCDDGNSVDDDCCSAECRFTAHECRPSTGRCDPAERCSLGVCPADFTSGDDDQDGACDNDDACRDVAGTRGFVDRSRLMLVKVNDGVSANERLTLRAAFDLSASTPFADYVPTSSTTIIRIESQIGTLLDASLPPDEYGGPGTRGWWSPASRRQWVWRDKTSDPIADVVAVRLSAVQTATGERVRVQVIARAHDGSFGLPELLPAVSLPLQASVTLGSFSQRFGRCGQSRFSATDCSFERDDTRLFCK